MKRTIAILLILALCIGTTAVFADAAEDVVVESEDTILKKDIDYTLTYRDNVDPGTATVTIKFIGNYAGEMERTFEIKKAKRTSSGGGGRGGSHVVVVEPVTKYDPPYITGYEDNTFRPEAKITRAEATTAIVRAIGLDSQNSAAAFDDVESHWANGYINAAASLAIVKGYEDGSFRPDENITRAEFAKMIAKRLGSTEQNGNTEYTDIAGHWAESYVAVLAEKGVITGYEDNAFHPDTPITRAEAVTIINRAVTRNCAPNLSIQFKDVVPTYWAYDDILKAAGRADD